MDRIISVLIAVIELILVFLQEMIILCLRAGFVKDRDKWLPFKAKIDIDLAGTVSGPDRDRRSRIVALPEQIPEQRFKDLKRFRLDLFTDIASL